MGTRLINEATFNCGVILPLTTLLVEKSVISTHT